MNVAATISDREAAKFRGIRRGFTLIEIMFSVLILGIVMALLIGGVRLATKFAKSTVDRQTVHSLTMAVAEFKKEFGFLPPLVRADFFPQMAGPRSNPPHFVQRPGGINKISVYLETPGDVQWAETWDGTYLTSVASATNPLKDYRYSEQSLAIYLVGELNIPYSATLPNIPIDGVQGPGFYKPYSDGGFEIPPDVLSTTSSSKRSGGKHDSLVNVGGSAPKLIVPSTTTPGNDKYRVALQDRNGIPIRYYRWKPAYQPATPPAPMLDLRVPRMVGRDILTDPLIPGFPTPEERDLNKSIPVRGAAFAIVAAGPDKAFGDEDFDVLCKLLGVAEDTANELKIRIQAEKDNIVEVGE